MPRRTKKDPKRRRAKLGQADKLPGAAWSLWTNRILATGPTWLYPVVCLGHLLCLRVTEVLSLQVQDINFEKRTVKVRALKKQAETDKVLGEAALAFLVRLRDEGISVPRSRNTGLNGTHGTLRINDMWNWPDAPEHYLFPARRRDNKLRRLSKDIV